MLLTSNEAFGFGQGVTGGGRVVGQGTKGPDKEREQVIEVKNKSQLKQTLTALAQPGTTKTVIFLAESDYDFSQEPVKEFRIRAKNITLQPMALPSRVVLKNLGLILDLKDIDNILIQNLAFHSDGSSGPDDGILFDGENSASGDTNRVRISHCTFDGYSDQAIEIRSSLSRLLATIDHCYFADKKPGQGDFLNRGALNIASAIIKDANNNITRTTANSYVTVAFNYFENIWRRSPRATADGTHAHIFNNLLYRWGFQKNGLTQDNEWNGMSIGILDGQTPDPANTVMAAILANRFIPWEDKQSLAIALNVGVKVDIGQPTTDPAKVDTTNRFDNPNGTSGNTSLVPDFQFDTLNVDAWYTGLGLTRPDGTPYRAPEVTAANSVPWATLVERVGPVGAPRPQGVTL